MTPSLTPKGAYARIYRVVARIPRGRVASYGQVAKLAGGCTARMVGYAMASVPSDADLPWHRVINSRGSISPRTGGDGDLVQRALLEAEGIAFDARGRVDWERFGWRPRRGAPGRSSRSSS